MQEVPPIETFLLPKPGTVDWTQASEEHKALYDKTMENLRQQVQQKRMLIEPVFKDFDQWVIFSGKLSSIMAGTSCDAIVSKLD